MAKHQMTVLVGGVPTNLSLGVGDSVEEFNTAPNGVTVGHAVYISGARQVAPASAAVLDQTCIGVVLEVLGRRSCSVLIQGVAEQYATDLRPGARYFLSEHPGKLAASAPRQAGRVVQCVGIALSTTDLLVIPDLHRVVNRSGAPSGPVCWNAELGCFELR